MEVTRFLSVKKSQLDRTFFFFYIGRLRIYVWWVVWSIPEPPKNLMPYILEFLRDLDLVVGVIPGFLPAIFLSHDPPLTPTTVWLFRAARPL